MKLLPPGVCKRDLNWAKLIAKEDDPMQRDHHFYRRANMLEWVRRSALDKIAVKEERKSRVSHLYSWEGGWIPFIDPTLDT